MDYLPSPSDQLRDRLGEAEWRLFLQAVDDAFNDGMAYGDQLLARVVAHTGHWRPMLTGLVAHCRETLHNAELGTCCQILQGDR